MDGPACDFRVATVAEHRDRLPQMHGIALSIAAFILGLPLLLLCPVRDNRQVPDHVLNLPMVESARLLHPGVCVRPAVSRPDRSA
jgi:hypothetical protein